MNEEGTLLPGKAGLWQRVLLPDGSVHAAAWREAQERGHVVGRCGCGGYLRAGPAYHVGSAPWFTSICADCSHETAHRGPKPAEKKTRRSA